MSKFTVKLFVKAEPGEPGSENAYQFTDEAADHGTLVAKIITETVDERPDVKGRLSQLRRVMERASKVRPKANPLKKPDGSKILGGWIQWHPESRTTGYSIRVSVRMHQPGESDNDNPDQE